MASPKCSFPSCESEIGSAVISLSTVESEVLFHRFEIDMKYLCGPHHKDQFTKYNSWHNKKCSDPCLRHSKPARTRLGVISLETAKSIKQNTEYRVIPGQSVCYHCRQFLSELVAESEPQEHQEQAEERGSFSGDLPMDEELRSVPE